MNWSFDMFPMKVDTHMIWLAFEFIYIPAPRDPIEENDIRADTAVVTELIL